ncbi:hypothetical protein PCE1_004931 [Barthelona sp. PCE]
MRLSLDDITAGILPQPAPAFILGSRIMYCHILDVVISKKVSRRNIESLDMIYIDEDGELAVYRMVERFPQLGKLSCHISHIEPVLLSHERQEFIFLASVRAQKHMYVVTEHSLKCFIVHMPANFFFLSHPFSLEFNFLSEMNVYVENDVSLCYVGRFFHISDLILFDQNIPGSHFFTGTSGMCFNTLYYMYGFNFDHNVVFFHSRDFKDYEKFHNVFEPLSTHNLYLNRVNSFGKALWCYIFDFNEFDYSTNALATQSIKLKACCEICFVSRCYIIYANCGFNNGDCVYDIFTFNLKTGETTPMFLLESPNSIKVHFFDGTNIVYYLEDTHHRRWCNGEWEEVCSVTGRNFINPFAFNIIIKEYGCIYNRDNPEQQCSLPKPDAFIGFLSSNLFLFRKGIYSLNISESYDLECLVDFSELNICVSKRKCCIEDDHVTISEWDQRSRVIIRRKYYFDYNSIVNEEILDIPLVDWFTNCSFCEISNLYNDHRIEL